MTTLNDKLELWEVDEPASVKNKRTVLIVDDNDITADILEVILEDDYQVMRAQDGRQGLDILHQFRETISIVFLDLVMPNIDGYQFLEIVGADEFLKRIPIIVMTGDAAADTEEKCLDLGAVEFINKPFNPKLILRKCSIIIRLREYSKTIVELRLDQMTGMMNRGAYYDDLISIERKCRESGDPVGIVYADINGLKKVNDRYGHEAGDKLIVAVSQKLRAVFDEADIYRIGGDEFVILSVGIAEVDLDKKVRELSEQWTADVSASLGSIWLENPENLEKSIAAADRRMYMNKSSYYKSFARDRRRNSAVVRSMDMLVSEMAEFLPGGFFIYRADQTETLVFFNRRLVSMYGCRTSEEFRSLTGGSFRGMVHPDDLDVVEKNITPPEQADGSSDYMGYRIICRDGEVRHAREFCHFAHTQMYGDVYYVFIIDDTNEWKKTEKEELENAVIRGIGRQYNSIYLFSFRTKNMIAFALNNELARNLIIDHCKANEGENTIDYRLAVELFTKMFAGEQDRESYAAFASPENIRKRLNEMPYFTFTFERVNLEGESELIESAFRGLPDDEDKVVITFRNVRWENIDRKIEMNHRLFSE